VPCDVVIAGAGPAGTLAATILVRAGARVRLFDRATFPRVKLCGDTLNPGALGVLSAHMSTAAIAERGVSIDGMLLTGPGVVVRGLYPAHLHGRALPRRDLDRILLDQAIAAGVEFEDRITVTAPLTNAMTGRVEGVGLRHRTGSTSNHPASIVIAADGRASRLARSAGLARYSRHPRRWAIGGYFEGVEGLTRCGEMHVRRGHYLGVAPVPGGIANACLVVTGGERPSEWARPGDMLMRYLRGDAQLAGRFHSARMIDAPCVLGPLGVDASASGRPGLLLAGDAAGFIDPITGDGLRFALLGAQFAAEIAADVLAGRVTPERATAMLARRRRAAFANKWRFNRAIRTLVSEPRGVATAALVARVVPRPFASVIRYAGDCGDARQRG
jgi:flavin-dependent dehydrogenase